jgi:glutathione synthase/RimK-type ligase-like ATP-grasp enzyme
MTTTLFIVDDEFPFPQADLKTIRFEDYLRDYPKLGEPKTRVINLCDTARYLSKGYYCSLLAEARRHQVLPSIKVINALRTEASLWMSNSALGKDADPQAAHQVHIICIGEIKDDGYRKLAAKVFQEYPAPLLEITLIPECSGMRVNVRRCSLSDLEPEPLAFCQKVLEEYSRKSWRKPGAGKKYRWDLAMLIDPNEAVPPSNKAAISRFIKAGEKQGIRVQPIAAHELQDLNLYDGLFIRETTAIDHHTYRLACKAEEQGLSVIDDSDSILRCCNKVFLHDAFNYQKVLSLKTRFVSNTSEATLDDLENSFGYPLVLKLPEGSFSKGVFKMDSRLELKRILMELLNESALVLAQEYLFTEYDWRVGVLNGRALYACRYYMARNHWQIYNHDSKRHFSGGFDTLPTFELPKNVLNAALKAASVVGNGLYGIDIKERDGHAYVLEVNDNPSIDHGIEDRYLGKELYMQIMSEFLRRLELRGR